MNIKKLSVYFGFMAIFAIAASIFISFSSAQNQSEQWNGSTQTNTIAAAPEDLFLTGETVEVQSDSVVGDLAAVGSTVTISGAVKGYAMTAGADVKVNAPVGNDLWAAGANVEVSNSVGDNAMIAGSSVVLGQNAIVGKDARIAASSVDIKGKITRNLQLAAASANISSEIGGNAEIHADTLTLDPGAIVRGDLIVYSPNEPKISQQAQIFGRVDHQLTESRRNPNGFGNWFGSWFITFLWLAVLGLGAVWFSSVWTNRVAEMIRRESGKSFLVGLVAALLVPPAFIILLITVAGLPLAFMLGAVAFVGFLLSGIFVAFLVGEIILRQLKRPENSNALKIIVGALVISLIMSLPFIGWLAKLAVFFFGFGAFLLERRDLLRQMRAQGLA
jgi:cytoskeletal protein CcmA (bactofilin family)